MFAEQTPIKCLPGAIKKDYKAGDYLYKISLDIDDCTSTCNPDGDHECRDYSKVADPIEG